MDSRKGSFPLNHCKLGHKPLHIKKVVVGQLLLLQDEERLQLLQEEQLIPLACIFSPETKLQRGPYPVLGLALFLFSFKSKAFQKEKKEVKKDQKKTNGFPPLLALFGFPLLLHQNRSCAFLSMDLALTLLAISPSILCLSHLYMKKRKIRNPSKVAFLIRKESWTSQPATPMNHDFTRLWNNRYSMKERGMSHFLTSV